MRSDDPFGCTGLLILFAAVALCGVGFAVVKNNHRETHDFTVSSKERQCDASGDDMDCYYVVFGTNGEVFENRDSGILNGKWDSASMQARFQVGKRYRVETIGWRVPWLSMKPNIVSMQEIQP
ncbi:DUF1523 family protein [Sphingobium lignivorans]|uniref:Uncharacterized protein n=1 Tax=Sphingobium lignivorans TaxID=2735886 RepID=A0ABR6NHJ1_9SPHN|nr:DUF1523 family protein [Sphingobium lignivorans]MBB5985988.1 hypothetical protein [Sphingobium lignivorans]